MLDKEQTPRRTPVTLRLGILLDERLVPAWVHSALNQLVRGEGIEMAAVIVPGTPLTCCAPGEVRRSGQRPLRERALAAYCRLDRAVFAPKLRKNAFELVDAGELLRDAVEINFTADGPVGSAPDSASDAVLNEIRACRLDLVLDFSGQDLDVFDGAVPDATMRGAIIRRAVIQGATTWGVISFCPGDADRYRGGPPLFWEMYEKNAVSGTTLKFRGAASSCTQILSKAYAATHPYSLLMNRNEVYWKSAALFVTKVKELQARGAGAFDGHPASLASSTKVYGMPTLGQLLKFVAGEIAEFLPRQVLSKFFYERWSLAIADHNPAAIANGNPARSDLLKKAGAFRIVKPPRGHFYADPCVVSDNGKEYVFFEDYVFKALRGRLGCLEVDPSSKTVLQNHTILEEKFHMSYPFVFKFDGTFYMIPETSEDSTVRLYRAEEFPWKWVLDTVLIDGVNAADCTLFFEKGCFWLFATLSVPGSSIHDELHIFYADELRGPWTPHPLNPIFSDVRRARGAGGIFKSGGATYRPSQNCSIAYGRSIVINKIDILNRQEYRETVVREIEPEWIGNDSLRTHTLSMDERLLVTDGLDYVSKFASLLPAKSVAASRP